MKKLLLAPLLLLSACIHWTSVDYSYFENQAVEKDYAKSVTARTNIILAQAINDQTINKIDKCFNDRVREEKYVTELGGNSRTYCDGGEQTSLINGEQWHGCAPVQEVKAFSDETYVEILDKLCNQYGEENDLRKADVKLLSCFEKNELGYKHPRLSNNQTPLCKEFAGKLKNKAGK